MVSVLPFALISELAMFDASEGGMPLATRVALRLAKQFAQAAAVWHVEKQVSELAELMALLIVFDPDPDPDPEPLPLPLLPAAFVRVLIAF